jgi:hypothetical protein
MNKKNELETRTITVFISEEILLKELKRIVYQMTDEQLVDVAYELCTKADMKKLPKGARTWLKKEFKKKSRI